MKEQSIYDTVSETSKKSCDEVLAEFTNHEVPIPILSREEFPADCQLPTMDLLVLKDFLSKEYPDKKLDESALLALAKLVEHWTSEMMVSKSGVYSVCARDSEDPAVI